MQEYKLENRLGELIRDLVNNHYKILTVGVSCGSAALTLWKGDKILRGGTHSPINCGTIRILGVDEISPLFLEIEEHNEPYTEELCALMKPYIKKPRV